MLGVVLALVLAWGLARLLTDTPEQVTTRIPVLNGSAGLAPDQKPITSSLGTPVQMTVKAVRGRPTCSCATAAVPSSGPDA